MPTERVDCPLESICRGGACIQGCRSGSDCLPSQSCTPGIVDAGVCFEARWYQKPVMGTGPTGIVEGSGAFYDERSDLVMIMKNGQWFGLSVADAGFDWVSVASVGSPGTLFNFASAWDPQRRTLVVQGGSFPGGPTCGSRRETWSYSAATMEWTQFTAPSPGGLSDHAMAFDAVRDRYIMFGGLATNCTYTTNTLELSATVLSPTTPWADIMGPPPPARSSYSLFSDPVSGRTFLYGGWINSSPVVVTSDSWQYNPQPSPAWANLNVSGPSARLSAAVAYDPRRGRFVLHGGFPDLATGARADTWEFNPVSRTWSQLTVAASPIPARGAAAIVYHARLGRVVLVGGRSLYNTSTGSVDVWVLGGP
jgi:hypothetical protein